MEYNGKQNPRSSSGTIFPSSYQDRSIPLNTPTDPRPIPTSSNKLSHRSSGSHSGTSAPHSKFITPQSASPNWNQLNQNSYSSASTVSFGAQLPSSDIGTIYPSTPRRYNAWLEESVAEDPNSPSINSFKSSRRRQSSLAMSSFVPSKVSADSNPDSLDHQGQMEVEDDWVVKGVYSELKLLTR